MFGRTFGAGLLVAGTTIGAGMLALPIETAVLTVGQTILVLFIAWAVMTFGALLTLEVNLSFKPPHHAFGTMARHVLGHTGELIMSLCFLVLLYALTAAYVTGGSQLLAPVINGLFNADMPNIISASIIALIMGAIIVHSTGMVDGLNRIMFFFQCLLFIVVIALLFSDVQISAWAAVDLRGNIAWQGLSAVLITGFGFNVIIPSLTAYCKGDSKNLRRAIIWGSAVPLLTYLFWIGVSRGVMPATGELSLNAVLSAEDQLSVFINSLGNQHGFHLFAAFTSSFAHLALLTSFLGVSLSLFDFLNDKCPGRTEGRDRRILIAAITFVPPLTFTFFYPYGFIMALQYAGMFVLIIGLVLPAFMVIKQRLDPSLKAVPSNFQVTQTLLLPICAAIGGLFIVWWQSYALWGAIGLIVALLLSTGLIWEASLKNKLKNYEI